MARRGRRYSNKQPHTNDKLANDRVDNCAACAGLIYMCNESTKIDCFKYGVLGLSEKRKHLLDMIVEGMYLFLFDVDSKLLYGVYAASSCGGFMLEPDAFSGNYPWQVRFHVEKDCLPLKEDIFKAAIKDNYFTICKFDIKLDPEQVQKLVSLFSPLPGGPAQHPRANALSHCATPCTDVASFLARSGHIQDKHTIGYVSPRLTYANETVEFIRRDPLPWLIPPNSASMTENCAHRYHVSHAKYNFLPPPLTYEAGGPDGLMQNALPKLYHEPLDADVVARECIYNHHIATAKHEHKCIAANPHQQCRVERDTCMRSSSIHTHNNAGPSTGPEYALHATSELQNSKLNPVRAGAELYPCNSASYPISPHLVPNATQGNFSDMKLCKGEWKDGSSSICSHANIAPKAPGVVNALLGHECAVNLHKRPLQDAYTYALNDTRMHGFDTSGERPLKCMHCEVQNVHTDDVFANAVDIVPSSVYIASVLHREYASVSGSNEGLL